jgi:Holliday junction resolvasome RuvABC endonuclease subunit
MKRIREVIDYYEPKVVVVEDFSGIGSRKSKRIQKLIALIEKYVEGSNLKVSKYSRNNIRFVFNTFGATSKYEIAKVITEYIQYQLITLPIKRKSHEPEHYSMNIFDAISLGVTHYYMEK